MFQCERTGIKPRIIDFSYQAIESPHFPMSLGIRTQTLKLQFVSPEKKGYFIRPGVSLRDMRDSIGRRFSGNDIYHLALIGERFSYIYAPFYIDGKLYDAILNRPVKGELPDDFTISSLQGGSPEWMVKFIPAQCPSCGWDMEGEKDSLVLECKNCESLWRKHNETLKQVTPAYLPSKFENTYYLPFWKIKAETKGFQLNSYADLARLSNLPKLIKESWESYPLYFWVPAFMARPDDIIRFSRNITIAQPFNEELRGIPSHEKYHVNMPVEEASEAIKTVTASLMKPARVMMPLLEKINIRPIAFLLVYVPFEIRRYELTNSDFRLRINKKILGYFQK